MTGRRIWEILKHPIRSTREALEAFLSDGPTKEKMTMRFTRDSLLLWLALLAAVGAYLLSVGEPPTVWTYQQWLQFVTAMIAVGVAKLQTSPLSSTAEKKANEQLSGKG